MGLKLFTEDANAEVRCQGSEVNKVLIAVPVMSESRMRISQQMTEREAALRGVRQWIESA